MLEGQCDKSATASHWQVALQANENIAYRDMVIADLVRRSAERDAAWAVTRGTLLRWGLYALLCFGWIGLAMLNEAPDAPRNTPYVQAPR